MERLNIEFSEDDASFIDFKVSRIYAGSGKFNGSVMAQILAYKDSRVDMHILDNVIGPEFWQNKYKRDSKGILQCGIGIWNSELKEWIWKWSNGIPSKYESEKGEYSDAFKRAGFMWGIGRCLYDFPTITIQLMESEYYMKEGAYLPTKLLRPNSWVWDVKEGFSSVTAHQYFGSKKEIRFNSNPYNSKKQLATATRL